MLFAAATVLAASAAIGLADMAGYTRLTHAVSRLDPTMMTICFVGQLVAYLGYVLIHPERF